MTNTGWIKQHRKEKYSAVFEMPPLHYKAWQWLKMTADYKTGKVKTSLGMMAEAIGWKERNLFKVPNKKTMREILSKFESNGMIALESNAQYTEITIINWDAYQNTEHAKVTVDGSAKVTPDGLPSGLPSGSPPIYNDRARKKLKEVKEVQQSVHKERENSTSSVPPDEQNYSLSETGKDLDLKTDTPVNRWIKKFQAYRPTAGHPLATLSPHDIADVRQRVAELIEWQTEPKAIELLQKAFEKPPRPSTVKQAVFACTKIVEASPPSSTGQHADTTPDVSQSIYQEFKGYGR